MVKTETQFIRSKKAYQRFYLSSNKAVFWDEEDGELYWFPCSSPSLFCYLQPDEIGGDMQPVSGLTDRERAELQELMALDEKLSVYHLAVVSAVPKTEDDADENNSGEILFIHKENPNTFFICPVDMIGFFNEMNTASLADYFDHRPMSSPYVVQDISETVITAY